MAIKRTFQGINISLPSGSGMSNKACIPCGVHDIYYAYGPGDDNKFFSWELCLDCGSDQKGGFDTNKRDRILARHQRNIAFFEGLIKSWEKK